LCFYYSPLYFFAVGYFETSLIRITNKIISYANIYIFFSLRFSHTKYDFLQENRQGRRNTKDCGKYG
jgi:hypothetical protein